MYATLRGSLLILLVAACGRSASTDAEAFLPPDEPAGLPRDAELPRIYMDTRYVPPTGGGVGSSRTVRAGEDLQATLDAARPGDVILLEAGASFVGNFTLPAKSGAGWIVIRSTAADANLPPAETRLTPAFDAALPKIVTPNVEPALRTAPGAHHYRLVGVEVTVAPDVALNYGIVLLGEAAAPQTSLAQVPHDLILDRVHVHGHPTLNVSRCVALNSATSAVIDSYLAECHAQGFDSQAIAGWNGPGPFKIVNNYLEGAGENVLFGGADPSIPNLTPSDIEIRRNHFTRPTSWKGVWTVKNLFELKHAQRVLVEGNVFEHHWADAQDGFAIVWKSVNQNGNAPWSVTRDITFRRNTLRNSGGGINLAARPEDSPALSARRVKIEQNVFDSINVGVFTGHGRLFQVLQDVEGLTIEHNTTFTPTVVVMLSLLPQRSNFVFRNNVTTRGEYGIFGTDMGEGVRALNYYLAPGFTFERNVLIGPNNGAGYPDGTFLPATVGEVRFVDLGAANYRLAPGSPYAKKATDGTDPGADIDAVAAATRGVIAP